MISEYVFWFMIFHLLHSARKWTRGPPKSWDEILFSEDNKENCSGNNTTSHRSPIKTLKLHGYETLKSFLKGFSHKVKWSQDEILTAVRIQTIFILFLVQAEVSIGVHSWLKSSTHNHNWLLALRLLKSCDQHWSSIGGYITLDVDMLGVWSMVNILAVPRSVMMELGLRGPEH